MLFRPPIIMKKGGKEEAWNAGYNGRHNFFLIRVFDSIKAPIGVLAQEVYEWRYSRMWGLVLGAPIIAAAYAAGGWIPAAVVGLLTNIIGPAMFPGFSRKMELRGHMIETVVATRYYGENEESYAMLEALSLSRYKQFKGRYTQEQCLGLMLAERKFAEKWVNRHKNWIEKRIENNDRNR